MLRFYRKLPTLETIIIEVYLPARLSTLLDVGIGRCVLLSCSAYRSKRAIRESRSQSHDGVSVRRNCCRYHRLRKRTVRSSEHTLAEPRNTFSLLKNIKSFGLMIRQLYGAIRTSTRTIREEWKSCRNEKYRRRAPPLERISRRENCWMMISEAAICDLLGRRRSSLRISKHLEHFSRGRFSIRSASYRFARLGRLFYSRAADARRTTKPDVLRSEKKRD